MWTALLVADSARCPGQETHEAVQLGLAVECMRFVMMALVVAATALATRLEQNLTTLTYTLGHWMSSSVLVVHKL